MLSEPQEKKPSTTNNSCAIEFDKVVFAYPGKKQKVLDNVSFQIRQSQYVAIIGHNGSGKSTIAKLLTGLFTADGGQIKIFNEILNPKNATAIRRSLGIVFQNPANQFVGSTVEDDIAFGLENRCIPSVKMEGIIRDCAAKVGMSAYLKSEPQMLSGGQKQKVAIASVLALSPKIIIFDEATSMLDAVGEDEIQQIMFDLKTKENKTIISITHNLEEVLHADYVIVLNHGKVLLTGTPQEVLLQHELLKKNQLDVPQVLQLAIALRARGINVDLTLHQDQLMRQIRALANNR